MTLILPFAPMACPRPRVANDRAFMPDDYRRWKQDAQMVLRAMGRVWVGNRVPLRVSVVAVFDRPKRCPDGVDSEAWKAGNRVKRWAVPDADNLFKAVADALQDAGFVANDSHIEIGGVTRWYAASGERAKVEISLEVAEDVYGGGR